MRLPRPAPAAALALAAGALGLWRAPAAPGQNPDAAAELDWVPRAALAGDDRPVPGCCGAFIDPLADADGDPAGADIELRAAAGPVQSAAGLIRIDGEVLVRQGRREARNDRTTTVDRESRSVTMEGAVVFREPGLMVRGAAALIDGAGGASRIEDARYVLHGQGVHGAAERLVHDGGTGRLIIDNGEFSRCEPGRRFWTLRAGSIALDRERGEGLARGASLWLGPVPVFYYPFALPFPLGDERRSGLLPPRAGATRAGGLELELPWYLNLAPHYDATVSPRWISDRGLLLGAEFRWLGRRSMNTLRAARLEGDRLFDPAAGPGADSPPRPDRWFAGLSHAGAAGRLRTFIDYNAVSDGRYFHDLDGGGLETAARSHLNRQGRVDWRAGGHRAGLEVQRIQLLDPFAGPLDKPFDILPRLHLDTRARLGAGFALRLRGQLSAFDRRPDRSRLSQEQIAAGALVTGRRLNLAPELGWSLEAPGGFARLRARSRHVRWRLENQATGAPDDPAINAADYSLDAGLTFERRSPDGAWTLEPRLRYLRSGFAEQRGLPLFDTAELNFSFAQLFRSDRFTGGDRLGDAHQAALALTARRLDRRGRERARLSIGRIRHFAERRVDLSSPLGPRAPRYSATARGSAVAGEMGLSLGARWRLDADAQWDPAGGELDEGSLRVAYRGGDGRVLNLAWRFLDPPRAAAEPADVDPRIRQSDLSAAWPLGGRWTLLARWNRDHANDRDLERLAGLQWRGCCATVRLVAREWVDERGLFVPNTGPRRGVFVQLSLSGLGDLAGGGLDAMLQDGIRGFGN